MLLDPSHDIQEVFCEHHEDILIKHHDGTFTGHQVKTRAEDQPLWKANEEDVLQACARFVRLESAYPGRFRQFCFLTNHPLHSLKNSQGLCHVLQQVRNAGGAPLPPNAATWIKKIAKIAKVTDSVAMNAMAKTVAKSDLPKLSDAVIRLIDTVAQCWPPANECSHDSIKRAALALIEECGRASSRHYRQFLPAYVLATSTEDQAIVAEIDSKRITLPKVQLILEQGRDSTALLECDLGQCVPPGVGSTELLHQKLDAGGFSAVSRNSAEDLRNKADYLGIKWTKQYGHLTGLKKYDHIRTLVLSDAGCAFDATQTETDGFGPKMREEMRRRFRERRESGDQLFDSTDDHLEGIAFSLTAQCKVVWSHSRPWEAK